MVVYLEIQLTKAQVCLVPVNRQVPHSLDRVAFKVITFGKSNDYSFDRVAFKVITIGKSNDCSFHIH